MWTRGILIAVLAVLISPALAQARSAVADDVGVQGGTEPSRPTTLPDLTNAQAVAPLTDIQGALKACFKAERASNPDLPGQVVLSYTIAEDGRAIEVELEPLALRGRPVEACAQEEMATLRWPRFTGSLKQVRVPFTLANHSNSVASVIEEPTVSSPLRTYEGGLARSEIQAVVVSGMSRIKRCYEAELEQQPNLAGKVTLQWVIRSTGEVGEVVVTLDTTGREALTKCMAAVIQPMVFPRPKGGGVVNVTYPFVFSTEPTTTTRAPVTIGPMTRTQVSGGLTQNVVEATVSALEFDTCADADADHIERADLRFVVSPEGRVTAAETSGSSMARPDGDDCIRGVINAATFPPATSETRVTWPLIFIPDPAPPPPPPSPPRPAPSAPRDSGCAWPW